MSEAKLKERAESYPIEIIKSLDRDGKLMVDLDYDGDMTAFKSEQDAIDWLEYHNFKRGKTLDFTKPRTGDAI